MKKQWLNLRRGYATALQKHVRLGARASLAPARRLGQQAVGLGVETLDLARIHEAAFTALPVTGTRNGSTKSAENFFNEALTPIIETHRAARESQAHLHRLRATLGERTEELAVSHRQLQRGIVRRKVMEEAALKNGKHHQQCLQESLQLQKRLRQLTYRVLTAQEDERQKISRELQDEIAQTLLGINVRLLSLKQATRSNTLGLRKEIASTQRLVLQSTKSVRRVAREFQNA